MECGLDNGQCEKGPIILMTISDTVAILLLKNDKYVLHASPTCLLVTMLQFCFFLLASQITTLTQQFKLLCHSLIFPTIYFVQFIISKVLLKVIWVKQYFKLAL